MKRTLIFIIATLCSLLALQAQGVVSGTVRDSKGAPAYGCTVVILQADSLVGGSATDREGNFQLKGLAAGKYVCRISMVGFKTIDHPFSLTHKVKLPKFTLEEDRNLLKEVVVTGDRRNMVQHRAGSSTYFLTERAKKSANAYEALLEIPKLNVNPVNRTIALVDGGNPLILVNGVKRTNYIDVLDPELIESVEVIENPSARYKGDEAVDCILNIHLKRTAARAYVNGNVYARQAVTSKHGIFGAGVETGTPTSSLYLNTQHFYFADDKSDTRLMTDTRNMVQNYRGERTYNSQSYWATLGGDRIFSDKAYAAFALTYIGHPSDTEDHRQGTISYPQEGKSSPTSAFNRSDNRYHAPNAQFYYRHRFSPKQSLEATGMYAYSQSSSEGSNEEKNDFYQYKRLIDFDNQRHLGKLKLDYSLDIGQNYHLSAGSNTSYTSTDIDDRNDLLPLYNHKRWQEYLYTGFDNNRSGSKLNYALSLALDIMHSNADGVKHSYVDVLPTASLRYRFNERQNLKLTYARQRSNPTADVLNPRNTSTDSLFVRVGNPYLTPVLYDRIALSYHLNYKKMHFSPQVIYTYRSNGIESRGSLDGDIYTSTFLNLSYAHLLTLSATIGYNFSFGNINLYGYYKEHHLKQQVFDNKFWGFSLNSYFYYKKVSLMVNCGYQNASYGLITKSNGIPYSNATFNWQLPKGWQLNVAGQYFLFPGMRAKSTTIDGQYTYISSSRMTSRTPMILVGFSYNFKNKVANKWRNKKQLNESDSELQGIKIR